MSLTNKNTDKYVNITTAEYFDELYRSTPRYWWRRKGRYDLNADAYPYSLLTQMTLRLIKRRKRRSRNALDLGAGEGADAIRLALLGYSVTAVEISKVAANKITRFANDALVAVKVQIADLSTYEPEGKFDIVICNGVLHYIEDKEPVIRRMQSATRPGGINVISVWSTYSDVPECHQKTAPIFCDDEDGVLVRLYDGWHKELLYFERDRGEGSHSDMPDHSHSHIKMIARKPARRWFAVR